MEFEKQVILISNPKDKSA